MTSILIVDDEREIRAAVARDLGAQGFDVHVAQSTDEALGVLGQTRVDVLLTDLRMPERDGIDLLQTAQVLSRGTPAILMSAFATARDYEAAIDLGVVRVLVKPFSRGELFLAIQQAVDSKTGFRGSVHGLSLIDLLQMFHYGRRSVTISVRGSVRGRIHLDRGEVVGAECGDLTAEPAFRAVLQSPSGTVHTSALTGQEPTISRSFQELMLDTLRLLDEHVHPSAHELLLDEPPPSAVAGTPPARWNQLDATVTHLVPDTTTAVFERDAPPTALRNAPDFAELREPVTCLVGALSRIAPGWTSVECVGEGFGLALLPREEGAVLLVAEPLRERHAAARFRSAIQRLAGRLSERTTEPGGGHGKDR
jgi:CheY-like chemotaxis protein